MRLIYALILSMLASVAIADDEFYEVGKSYLFLPRLDFVIKGKLIQVTDHELVFTDRAVLKASLGAVNKSLNDEKAASIRSNAIYAYLHSKNKKSLLQSGPLSKTPVSFSRTEMTAIKLEE